MAKIANAQELNWEDPEARQDRLYLRVVTTPGGGHAAVNGECTVEEVSRPPPVLHIIKEVEPEGFPEAK